MSRRIVVVGAGGHGREVLDVLEAINDHSAEAPWAIVGFVDDGPLSAAALDRMERRAAPLLGPVEAAVGLDAVAIVAMGDGPTRRAVAARLVAAGVSLAPALVHPAATTGGDVDLADGVVVAAGSQLTTNVRIGEGVQVNVGCSVSHDVVVGSYATLSPGCRLTGGAVVGDDAFFGTGAIVAPLVEVGARARVGAGSVVLHDVPPGQTVVGAPARSTAVPAPR